MAMVSCDTHVEVLFLIPVSAGVYGLAVRPVETTNRTELRM